MLSGLIWRDLGIPEQEWIATPLAVRTALLSLRKQGRDVLAYLTNACRGASSSEVLRGLIPNSSWRTPLNGYF